MQYMELANSVMVDNILITKNGSENLTTAIKDISEMEEIINGCA
jgi:Xaa-Pro dipeptidase